MGRRFPIPDLRVGAKSEALSKPQLLRDLLSNGPVALKVTPRINQRLVLLDSLRLLESRRPRLLAGDVRWHEACGLMAGLVVIPKRAEKVIHGII